MQRSRRHHPPAELLAPTVRQTQAENAARYVRMYLKRGATAPPDVCERCEVQSGRCAPLPDPAQKRLVAWLCADCQRRVRATGEPLTLSWTWPGIMAPCSRKPPDLPGHVAGGCSGH